MKPSDAPEVWRKIEVESKIYNYNISNHGTVIKTSKKRWRESPVKQYNKNGKATVKISNQEFCVKHLVANAFIFGYENGKSVTHKDGNPKNCDSENLIVLSKRELGKITGGDSRRKPVTVNGVEYYSIRDCAKSLHCSYQTVLDYMGGRVKNSVLAGTEIKKG